MPKRPIETIRPPLVGRISSSAEKIRYSAGSFSRRQAWYQRPHHSSVNATCTR